ncbi:MAG TPA: DMT family transporter [Myxococcales bacterium]|nr:DMT family transporter [Myxococcales bacterium]
MADLALAAVMAIWGSTFAVVRTLVGGDAAPVSPLLLVAVRMVLASALLLGWLAARGQLRFSPGVWRDGLVCAALLGGGFLLQIEGQHRTTASRSGFLTGLVVVFVPLIELLLFRKRPSLAAAVGIALAFTGMLLLSRGGAAGHARLVGDLLTVGCSIVFAGHISALGRFAPRHPVLPLLFVQLAGTGAIAAAIGPLVETQHFSGGARSIAAVAYLAILATLLTFGIQTWAQQRLSAIRMALISALEPVFAAAWAAVLIGERLTAFELGGGALIVLGVVVGETGSALLARRSGTG